MNWKVAWTRHVALSLGRLPVRGQRPLPAVIAPRASVGELAEDKRFRLSGSGGGQRPQWRRTAVKDPLDREARADTRDSRSLGQF